MTNSAGTAKLSTNNLIFSQNTFITYYSLDTTINYATSTCVLYYCLSGFDADSYQLD